MSDNLTLIRREEILYYLDKESGKMVKKITESHLIKDDIWHTTNKTIPFGVY